MKNRSISLIILLLSVIAGREAVAAITLPAIFGTNMVLQSNIKVPIWGWAEAGENIQVIFKGKTFKVIAGADGKWETKLGKYDAGGPYEMLIKTDREQLKFTNILIGEVWIASGQSNMEFGIQTEKSGAEAIAKATDSLIHFFYVPMAASLQPQSDIAHAAPGSPNGKWVVCSPSLMADPKWAWHGFSAVGYYFAEQIRKTQACPVGMIGTYKGGTPAQAWVSINSLQRSPAFVTYVDKHQALVDHYEEAKAAYPKLLAAYREGLIKWNEEVGKDYDIIVKQWEAATVQAKADKQPLPAKPKPLRPAPQNPIPPDGPGNTPSNLYNAMVAPIVTYGMKGVLWYQGESNGDRLSDAVEYRDLFARLIVDWRENWHEGNFPFLFVQLANHHAPAITPSEGYWPWVREAQLNTLEQPNTGMAVIIDIGEGDNIHPLNKKDVGLRLALVARHSVYKENLVYSGPMFKSMKIEGNKIRLAFNCIGSGLMTSGNTGLKGFGLAGNDQKFVWAKAVIEGDTILVSADGITDPAAVRYNWGDNPAGNLYNKEGLPASPFRTDNWAPPLTPVK